MSSWVKTSELKKILPASLSDVEISHLSGVPPRKIWEIRKGRTEYTDFYKADQICVGLDRIADFHYLEEFTAIDVKHRQHGISAYQKRSCRCEVCCEAKRRADQRYRTKRRSKLLANAN